MVRGGGVLRAAARAAQRKVRRVSAGDERHDDDRGAHWLRDAGPAGAGTGSICSPNTIGVVACGLEYVNSIPMAVPGPADGSFTACCFRTGPGCRPLQITNSRGPVRIVDVLAVLDLREARGGHFEPTVVSASGKPLARSSRTSWSLVCEKS